MRLRITALLLLFGITPLAFSQKRIADIPFQKTRGVGQIRGMVQNDIIFLKFKYTDATSKPAGESYLIKPDGTYTEIDLHDLDEKPVLALITSEENTVCYFLEDNKKNVVIRAKVISTQTGKGNILPRQIDLPGNVYGSYTEGNALYLLCSVKGGFNLKLVRIEDLEIKQETIFPLSFDLGKIKKAGVTFYEAGSNLIPAQVTSPVKIVKEKSAIRILVDQFYNRDASDPIAGATYSTSVITLDLVTGKSSNFNFIEPSLNFFNSFLFHEHLFRVVNDGGFRIEVFNLEKKAKVYTQTIPADNQLKNDTLYTRQQKEVRKSFFLKKIVGVNINSFILADSLSDGNLVLTLGNFGVASQPVPIIPSLGLMGAMVSLTSLAAIHALDEGSAFYNYFYVSGSVTNGFRISYEAASLRKNIDQYEFDLQEKKEKFKYKGYLSHDNGIYGIYRVGTEDIIHILDFSRK
ncbi:MAG TPA: hypothetical protein VGK59_17465 [Ohtaekwangia sp.]